MKQIILIVSAILFLGAAIVVVIAIVYKIDWLPPPPEPPRPRYLYYLLFDQSLSLAGNCQASTANNEQTEWRKVGEMIVESLDGGDGIVILGIHDRSYTAHPIYRDEMPVLPPDATLTMKTPYNPLHLLRPLKAICSALALIAVSAWALTTCWPGHSTVSAQVKCGPMDVAFIVDDTGSMGGAINYATRTGGVFIQTAANGTGTAGAIMDIIDACGGQPAVCGLQAPQIVKARPGSAISFIVSNQGPLATTITVRPFFNSACFFIFPSYPQQIALAPGGAAFFDLNARNCPPNAGRLPPNSLLVIEATGCEPRYVQIEWIR